MLIKALYKSNVHLIQHCTYEMLSSTLQSANQVIKSRNIQADGAVSRLVPSETETVIKEEYTKIYSKNRNQI